MIKKFLFLLIPVLLFSQIIIQPLKYPGGGASPTYLINQNFEGTGYDNSESWTETAGSPDEDYTGVVLRGSQSLRLDNSGSTTPVTNCPYLDTTATGGEDWIFFRVQFPGDLPNANVSFMQGNAGQIGDAGSLWGVWYRTSITGFRFTDGNSNIDSGTITAGTTYYIWIRYVQGSGTNAELQVWIDTDNTRPASALGELTNGPKTRDTRWTSIGMTASAQDMIIDQFIMDDAEITNVSE